MRKEFLFCVGFLVFFAFVSLTSADFEVHNSSSGINTNYFSGELVRGFVNISLNNENSQSRFESNLGGGITLEDLLDSMGYSAGNEFTCSPTGCARGYKKDELEFGESLDFNLDSKRVYGFVLNGDNVRVKDVSIEIYGGHQMSCRNQIYIDLFNDKTVDLYNTHYNDEECTQKNFGCFDGHSIAEYGYLSNDYWFCEKVNLPIAPAYRVGAVLNLEGEGSPVDIALLNENGTGICPSYGSSRIVPSGSDVSTVIPCGFLENITGYACIKMSNADDSLHQIRIETDTGHTCGARRENSKMVVKDADYEIYAVPLAYNTLGTLELNVEYKSKTGKNLWEAFDKYILENYNRSCNGDGCIIPFSFMRGDISDFGMNQIISLKKSFVSYENANSGKSAENFFRIYEDDYKINSNSTIFDIGKMNFLVPGNENINKFILNLGGKNVLDEEINISEGFSFSVSPRFSLIGLPTTFVVNRIENVSSVRWDFGDGTTPVTVSADNVRHTFLEAGEYVVSVQVTRGDGALTRRSFNILVGEPKVSARIAIEDYERKLNRIDSKINGMDSWFQDTVKKAIGYDEIKSKGVSARNSYEILSSNAEDSEYVQIIELLLQKNIPSDLIIDTGGILPAEMGFSGIKPALLDSISQDGLTNPSGAIDAIIGWIGKNYEIDLQIKTVSANYNYETETIANIYKITLNRKEGADEERSYLVINHPKSKLKFKSNYEQGEIGVGEAAYVPISSSGVPNVVEFAIGGNNLPSLDSLGIYVAPRLSSLSFLKGTVQEAEKPKFGWWKFIWGIIIILVILSVGYLALQYWYKRNYERHLFKNSNDLYNIINFIYNSRKERIDDKSIKTSLKSKKWTGEQISYAFNKIDGKTTGLWEIPVFKLFENRKVKSEIQKRNAGPIDTRFIKR